MKDITRTPIKICRLFLVNKAKLTIHPFLINKVKLADGLFCVALLQSFISTITPWFVLPVISYMNVLTAAILSCVYILSMITQPTRIGNKRYMPLLFTYAMLMIYMGWAREDNINGMISTVAMIFSYTLIFKASGERLRMALRFICKAMATLLAVSIFMFTLYLLGFPLPYSNLAVEGHSYSFSNYYFFLIFDWNLWLFLPRFQSVFLEPSHMAVPAVFLLMTEIGRWTKWYNLILLLAVILSFSAEAYVLLTLLFFLGKWIKRKHFVRNIVIIITALSTLVIGSFFYNDGDNLFNTLIVSRFEVNDGEVAGDNRVTDEFQAEFDGYLQSPDVLFGRVFNGDLASSGYKVFLYNNGIIGTVLLAAFYWFVLYNPNNKRPALTAFFIMLVHFVVRAHMVWTCTILTAYYMAQWYQSPQQLPKQMEKNGTIIAE